MAAQARAEATLAAGASGARLGERSESPRARPAPKRPAKSARTGDHSGSAGEQPRAERWGSARAQSPSFVLAPGAGDPSGFHDLAIVVAVAQCEPASGQFSEIAHSGRGRIGPARWSGRIGPRPRLDGQRRTPPWRGPAVDLAGKRGLMPQEIFLQTASGAPATTPRAPG